MSSNSFLTITARFILLFTFASLCNGKDSPSSPQVANYNHQYDLVCSDVDFGVEVEWKKNNVVITVEDKKSYEIFQDNNTLRVLKVDQVTVGDYVCTGNNHSQVISLHARPYVEKFDKEKNVIESDPLTIGCIAWGYPEPVITWYKGQMELFSGDLEGRVTLKNSSTGTFPALENGTLRINDIKFDIDNGTYLCYATNEHDRENATMKVNVKSKYAALWPFLGICAEVAILCTIILIYEKRRTKRLEAEEAREEAAHLNANNDTKASANADEDVRHRK